MVTSSLFCSFLQRNYFSCKKQFDIQNLNSSYTQVSVKIHLKGKNWCETHAFFWALASQGNKVKRVFVCSWRVKACIKPWASWMCCLTTLRDTWRPNGTGMEWLQPDDPLTLMMNSLIPDICFCPMDNVSVGDHIVSQTSKWAKMVTCATFFYLFSLQCIYFYRLFKLLYIYFIVAN